MGAMPVVKRFMRENCLKDLKDLKCYTESNKKEHKQIVDWLDSDICQCKIKQFAK